MMQTLGLCVRWFVIGICALKSMYYQHGACPRLAL